MVFSYFNISFCISLLVLHVVSNSSWNEKLTLIEMDCLGYGLSSKA